MTPKKLPSGANVQNSSQPMELKKLLEPVVTAAFLTRQNVMVVSEPGYGKTEILDAMGKQVFGAERTMLFPCVPSTLPADIVGYANPVYSIDPDAEANGVPYWITKGTPVNEQIQFCLLDEVGRFGDLGSDTAVHAMHNISRFHRPVYCATSNWLTATPRTEAMRDRFSFTVWYMPSTVDVRALVSTPKIQGWVFDLPTMEQIDTMQVWLEQYTTSPIEYNCNEVIMTLLEQIQKLCEGTIFKFNNRRVHQFRAILYAMGAHYAQAQDFTELPRQAFKALEQAYPITDFNQALKWRQIIASVVDVVETEIAEFKANAYESWQSVFATHADRSGKITSQAGKDAMSIELGRAWASNEELLMGQFPNDPRAKDALREMFSVYRQLLQGKNPLASV